VSAAARSNRIAAIFVLYAGAFEAKGKTMSLILLIILVLLVLAVMPAWPYSRGWGYYPSGGLGIVLLIILILVLSGHNF